MPSLRSQFDEKLPRWKPRSSRFVYVGMSSKHASSAPLCLNLETGAIGPQYHVIFDDDFATVSSDPANLPDFGSPQWTQLFGDSVYQYVVDDDVALSQDDDPAVTTPPPCCHDFTGFESSR